jgi:hypothetical protein
VTVEGSEFFGLLNAKFTVQHVTICNNSAHSDAQPASFLANFVNFDNEVNNQISQDPAHFDPLVNDLVTALNAINQIVGPNAVITLPHAP